MYSRGTCCSPPCSSVRPCFVCTYGHRIFASRERMHAFLGDKARKTYTVLKAVPRQTQQLSETGGCCSEAFPGERFPPWLLNYHRYLSESWVFRNGLNQWNKKGRCLMVFRWVLKISSGITKWCLRFLLQKLTLGSIPLLPTACK